MIATRKKRDMRRGLSNLSISVGVAGRDYGMRGKETAEDKFIFCQQPAKPGYGFYSQSNMCGLRL